MSLEQIIWCLFAGIVLAVGITYVVKYTTGRLVRALLRKKAISPESALTPQEAGVRFVPFLSMMLRQEESAGRKILHFVTAAIPSIENETAAAIDVEDLKEAIEGHTAALPKSRVDVRTMKFYIPEEKNYRAELIYGKKGTNILGVLFLLLVLVGIALVSFEVIPMLLDFASGLL